MVRLLEDTLYFKKGDIMRFLFEDEGFYLVETLKDVDRSKEKYEEFILPHQCIFIGEV